ncbi:amine oxidase catalytic domain-containing protein [Trichoderma sp. SZMC 28015]
MKMFASRTFGLIISVYLAAFISSYSYYAWSTSWSRVKAHHQQSSPYPVCKSRQPSVSAPHQNIWGGLADKEAAGIIDFLHQHSTGLNLTTEDRAGSWDNRILHLELLAPNKSDVLLFINKNTTKPPPRYARATLMFGATPNPFLQDYVIGPLPITNNTQVQPLRFLYNNAGKGKVAVDFADRSEVLQFAKDVGLSVADITKLLWDGTLNDTLSLLPQYPPSKENGRLIVWSSFISNPTSLFNSETILPLGLYFGLDITGRDPSKWSLIGWYYNGIYYPTTSAFRTAAMSNNFTVLGANFDGPWARLDKQGTAMTYDHYPPPTAVMPGSNRFSIDTKENYVEWMDFSFFLSYNRDNGLRLFNVQYKGRRILYELGLQEALAHYAGNDPVQSGTTYFDSKPGVGPSVVSLIDGYDCPTYSTYLNVTYGQGENFHSRPNAICLFEFDQGYPIQRHSAANYTSITKNIAFIVRSVSTIANYDYMFSYTFFLDGSIEVSVRASGYILGGFSANNEEYGWTIHDNLSGSIHDHILTYKADIDIFGEKNSLQKVEFVPVTTEYPWSNGAKRNTMKIQKSFIQNENETKINWAPNGAATYAIVNKEARNTLGEYPGYKFSPASNAVFLTVLNSSNAMNAVNFADHHFYVTKQKDTEAQASHPYNVLDPIEPIIDFAKFFDGESLDQEDLVLWFNLGMHHAPHTGDLPNTVFTTAHSALIIEPLNYLDLDASRATSQQVRLNYKDGKVQSVKTFDSQNVTCHVDASQLIPNFWRDTGTTSVLKYLFGASQEDGIANAT